MTGIPTVSIIIPTYNRPGYLRLTLESISRQTYRDFEVIVVDDGSPSDETEILCGDFEFCTYLKINNSGGPATPRNRGVDLARGKYLAFVDDDDLWYPEKLDIQVSILDKESEYGLVHSYCDCIDENGESTGAITGKPGHPSVKHGACFVKMIGNWTVMMPTPLIRTDLVKKINGFNPFISRATEDVEFFTRLALYTKFWYIDKPLVQYRVHGGNISGITENYKDLPVSLSRIAEDAFLSNQISLDELFLIQRRLYFKFLFYEGRKFSKNIRKPRLKILKKRYTVWDWVRFGFYGLKLRMKILWQK